LEEVLRRLAKVEHRCDGRDGHLSQLDAKCRCELATQRDLNTTNERMADGVATVSHELQEGLAELRQHAADEQAAVREDLTAQIDKLSGSLSKAHAEITRLTVYAQELSTYCAETYQTKKHHEEAVSDISSQLSDLSRTVQQRCDFLQDHKMSHSEFIIDKKALELSVEHLRCDQADTEKHLKEAVQSIGVLERKEAEDIRVATNTLSELLESTAATQRQLRSTVEFQNQLRTEFNADHQYLEQTASRQLEADKRSITLLNSLNQLETGTAALRGESESSCQRLREDLAALDRREISSWERFIQHRPWPAS